jgi:integrase
MPRIRLHDVRHTYATIALDSGVDLKIVSERLGHASMNVTAQIYAHKSTGRDADTAPLIAELIFMQPEQRASVASFLTSLGMKPPLR